MEIPVWSFCTQIDVIGVRNGPKLNMSRIDVPSGPMGEIWRDIHDYK